MEPERVTSPPTSKGDGPFPRSKCPRKKSLIVCLHTTVNATEPTRAANGHGGHASYVVAGWIDPWSPIAAITAPFYRGRRKENGQKLSDGGDVIAAIGLQGVNPSGYNVAGVPTMAISGTSWFSGVNGGVKEQR